MCELLFVKGDAHTSAYTPRQTHPRAGGGESIFLERSESLGARLTFNPSKELPPTSSLLWRRDWASPPSPSGGGERSSISCLNPDPSPGGRGWRVGRENLFLSNSQKRNSTAFKSNPIGSELMVNLLSHPPQSPSLPLLPPQNSRFISDIKASEVFSRGKKWHFLSLFHSPPIGLVCRQRRLPRG